MTKIHLNGFYEDLLYNRKKYKIKRSIKKDVEIFINDLLEFLFPHFSEQKYYDTDELESKLTLLQRNLKVLLKSIEIIDNADEAAEDFFGSIPELNILLWKDAEAIYRGDPAADSVDEVILAYPGFFAIAIYRFAHELYKLNIPLIPRIMSEFAHQITGIDINPGAEIGHSFFIDHGTGIVIGETANIGNNVKLYQGVTLGALSVEKSLANVKRHPTIEDNVIIYSNAVILGGKTVVGKDSVVGGNTWLTKSVPPKSIVYNRNEIALKNDNFEDEYLDFVI